MPFRHRPFRPLERRLWVGAARPPFSYAAEAPVYWRDDYATDPDSVLGATPGRESEPPYFSSLSTELMIYPVPTPNLKVNIHTHPVGEVPRAELEPTDHPLAVEQRTGITVERVREIAALVEHGTAA